MSNANGIITAPVSLHGDVASVLGLGTYDLATLCTSDKINVWAKYKPVKVNCIPELTERQRYEVDYGIDVAYAMSLDIASLFTKAEEEPSWRYIKPEGYYRLTDFEGYNHNAKEPYRFSFPEESDTNKDTYSTTFYIVINSDSEINPATDFAIVDQNDKTKFKFGIAYKHEEWTDAEIRFALGNAVSDNPSTIEIPVTFPKAGNYTILPIMTQETGTLSEGQPSIYLPNGYRKFLLRRVVSYAKLTISNYSNISWTYDNDMLQQNMSASTTNISIVSADGDSVPQTYGTFTYKVLAYNNSGRYIGEAVLTVSGNTGYIDYVGTSTKTYSLDWNYGPSEYDLSAYGIDIENIHKLIITPFVTSIKGDGAFTFDSSQQWTVYR